MIALNIKQKLMFSSFGYGFPLIVAVLTIPWLVQELGEEAFGLLTLGWVLVGFASIFDLGLGRALTKYVSERVAQDQLSGLWGQVVFVFKVMLLISTLILFLAEWVSPWLIREMLVLSADFRDEALSSIMLLLISIPIVVVSNLLIAVLEGTGRVKSVALVRAMMGGLMFVLPMIAWQLSLGMQGVMLSLLLVRAIALLSYLVFAKPILHAWFRFRETLASSHEHWTLLKTGGWMSVSTILAPILTTMDRFIIGAVLSVSLVTYYATPVDMLMKLQVFSAALMAVIFPAFAAAYVSNHLRIKVLYLKSVLLLGVFMFLVALITIYMGKQVLAWWLNESFAQQSEWVLYWAAIGLFVNSMSFVPFALLQAIGRADITAKLNLFEMPLYFASLFWALSQWGIVGAAIVSSARLMMNACLLFFYSGRYYEAVRALSYQAILLMILGVSILLLLLESH